MGTTSSKR